MTGQVEELVAELKAGLIQLYGPNLNSILIFGSYARGEQDNESDLDVLVILDHFEHYGTEIDRSGHLTSDLSLKYGVSISTIFVTHQDWLERDTPLLRNARFEAIAA